MNSKTNSYNYVARSAVTPNQNYTCPNTGLIFAYGQEGYDQRYFSVNGSERYPWIWHYGSGFSSGELMFPVKKGDSIHVQSASGHTEVWFIPAN